MARRSHAIKENSVSIKPPKLFKELERFYTLKNPKEINEFLLDNESLFEILFEAPEQVLRVFGKTPLLLELHRDPEEGWDELFVIIKSPFSVEESIRREDRLGEKWFLEKMPSTKGKLNVVEEPL